MAAPSFTNQHLYITSGTTTGTSNWTGPITYQVSEPVISFDAPIDRGPCGACHAYGLWCDTHAMAVADPKHEESDDCAESECETCNGTGDLSAG